jgi:hypothetical protein
MQLKALTMMLISALSFSNFIAAQPQGAEYHNNHHHSHHMNAQETVGAHIHGEALLMVALEGLRIHVELQSPAMNIVGFEHPARNATEAQSITDAMDRLSVPKPPFSFIGARCGPEESITVKAGDLLAEYKSGSKSHRDNKSEQMHEHIDIKHQEYEQHGRGYPESETNLHQDIVMQYHVSCKNPVESVELATTLFELFPVVNKIKVQWVSDFGQGGGVLTPDQTRIRLFQ